VIVAANSLKGIPAPLIRALAAAPHDLPLAVRLASLPQDHSTSEWIASAIRATPGVDIHLTVLTPPTRFVPDCWLAGQIVDRRSLDIVLLASPGARPSPRDVSPLSALLAAADADVLGTCPVPAPGGGAAPGRIWVRLATELAPAMFATHGPAGILPALVAAKRDALSLAFFDPLWANRPAFATAVCHATAGTRVILLPHPVGFCGDPEPPVRDLLAPHLRFLARVSAWRTALLAGWLAALPAALLAWLLPPSGPWTGVLVVAGGVALVSRALIALTWNATIFGTARALGSLVLAPLRDTASLGLLCVAIVSREIRRCGMRFRFHRGGVLSPLAEARDDGGD
jgi:hypothetical protein